MDKYKYKQNELGNDEIQEAVLEYNANKSGQKNTNKDLGKDISTFLRIHEQGIGTKFSEILKLGETALIHSKIKELHKNYPKQKSFTRKTLEHGNINLLETKLIYNEDENLLDILKKELLTCDSFEIVVSFIRTSGLGLLVNTLNQLQEQGVQGRVITTTYMNVTEPNALETLLQYSNIDVKIYQPKNSMDSFHTKSYIFHRDDNLDSIILGSSNISKAALKSGEEWNLRTYEKYSDDVVDKSVSRFEELWNHKQMASVNEEYVVNYKAYRLAGKAKSIYKASFDNTKTMSAQEFQPNSMQSEAIKNIKDSIEKGHTKALAIAATGTGKTYLAAFAAEDIKAKSILFVAHRIELLEGAYRTFRSVFGEGEENFSFYNANEKVLAKYTFASRQTLTTRLNDIPKDQFDFIIIDEFHHATSPQYEKIMSYFQAKFLLGLTATPERTDHGNIYELAENNIVSDVRLDEALTRDLLAPFHYFGISDDTITNLNDLSINQQDLVRKLNTNMRIDLILSNMKKYQYSGDRLHGLGFCVNKEHAEYMCEQFNLNGIESVFLTGKNSDVERRMAIKKLRDEKDNLEFIFTIDIFNEGVDIPELNLILFLRPTESAIVFTQQLGRGLRKSSNKEYVTVLDFVANHRKNYLIPIALMGDKEQAYINKNKIRYMVQTDFKDVNASLHIELAPIVKEQILQVLDTTKFNKAENICDVLKDFDKVVKQTTDTTRTVQILDFVQFENAPGIKQLLSGTYKNIHLIKLRAKLADEIDIKISRNDTLEKIFNNISALIPIRKFYDYIAMVMLLKNGFIDTDEMQNYIEYVYSMELSKREKIAIQFAIDRVSKLGVVGKNSGFKEGKLIINDYISSLMETTDIKKILNDYLDFGMQSYKLEFGADILLKKEKLVLYAKYSKMDVAASVGFGKDLSIWNREGVQFYDGCFYLFVTLIKDADEVPESQRYNDYFIAQNEFHWETQPDTGHKTKQGLKYRFHKKEGINVKLFVRKRKKEDNVTEPFIYIGEAEYVSSKNDKPMSIVWHLKETVPLPLFNELTY